MWIFYGKTITRQSKQNNTFTGDSRARRRHKKEKTHYINPETGQVVSEIFGTYQALIKNAEGEAEIHTLEKHSVKQRPLPETLDINRIVPTADRVIIRTSRAKSKARRNKILFDVPDIQMGWRMRENGLMEPIYSPEAIDVMLQLAKDIQPDMVVLGGDELDWPEFSRFTSDNH